MQGFTADVGSAWGWVESLKYMKCIYLLWGEWINAAAWWRKDCTLSTLIENRVIHKAAVIVQQYSSLDVEKGTQPILSAKWGHERWSRMELSQAKRTHSFHAQYRYLHVWCPEGEVVAEQLHDEGAILVGFLSQCVKLCNRLIECLQNRMHMSQKQMGCGSFHNSVPQILLKWTWFWKC